MPGFAHWEVITDTVNPEEKLALSGGSKIGLCQHIFQKHNTSKEKIRTAGNKKEFLII